MPESGADFENALKTVEKGEGENLIMLAGVYYHDTGFNPKCYTFFKVQLWKNVFQKVHSSITVLQSSSHWYLFNYMFTPPI